MNFRYLSLEINDYRAFEGQSTIEFGPGTTVIVGGCGTGKTTLAEVLLECRRNGAVRVDYEGDLGSARDKWLPVHIDASSAHTRLLQGVLAEWFGRLFGEERDEPVRLINESLNKHLEKLLPNRFGRAGYQRVVVDREGRWWLATGERLDRPGNGVAGSGEVSFGEEVSLWLGMFMAVRDALAVNLPIVADSLFGPLDLRNRKRAWKALTESGSQLIVLSSEQELAGLPDAKPDYVLEYDPERGRTRAGKRAT